MMSLNDVDPHTKAQTAIEEGRPIEAQYVRQGRKNYRIVWVLAISLALAALATFGFWLGNADELRSTDRNTGLEAVDRQAFGTSTSVPGTTEGGMTGAQRAPASATGEEHVSTGQVQTDGRAVEPR
jgi:hypothetical protein